MEEKFKRWYLTRIDIHNDKEKKIFLSNTYIFISEETKTIDTNELLEEGVNYWIIEIVTVERGDEIDREFKVFKSKEKMLEEFKKRV